MAAPRGYQELERSLTGTNIRLMVLLCKKCGAVVELTQTHNQWHRDNDKKK